MATDTHILIIQHGSHGANQLETPHELAAIADTLKSAGYSSTLYMDTEISSSLGGTPIMPSMVLFHSTDRELLEADCTAAIANIRYHYGKSIPIIAILPDASRKDLLALFNNAIFLPVYPEQIVQRISSVLRLEDICREIKLRLKTFKLLNASGTLETLSEILTPRKEHTNPKTGLNAPFRILFIGKATTEFMTIMNALQDRNVDFIAAFSSFTAFDYLHDESFDGVIINAENSAENSTDNTFETAMAITATMRRNTALYNVPAIALTDQEGVIDPKKAFENGLNDILTIGTPSAEIAGRILELAHFHRSQEKIKAIYKNLAKSDVVEPDTGLYRADFFKTYIGQSYQLSQSQKTPLTLAVFSTKPILKNAQDTLNPRALNAALQQIGGMIRSVVRIQDCAARLTSDQFAILFPSQNVEQVTPIAQRICDMISCTAFDNYQTPFQIELDLKIVPVKPVAAQEPDIAPQPVSDLDVHEKGGHKTPKDNESEITPPINQTGLSA